jgi:hypothetical protein
MKKLECCEYGPRFLRPSGVKVLHIDARVTHLLIADVDSGAKQYRQLLRQTLNIDYVELAFKEYETQLRQSSQNFIK